jgi:hypothetical protein
MERRRRLQLTPRDLELLAFVAEHRVVLAGHAQALMVTSAKAAYTRLHALTKAGLLSFEQVFHRKPGCYRITTRGLRAVGSSYPSTKIDLHTYDHDVGVAWLYLAARRGTFGPVADVLSERALRSHDERPGRSDPPMGVRLGGLGATGRERLHYPDLLLVTPQGRRIAIELELTAKGRARRHKILSGYAADARIDAVVYLVERAAVGEPIRASARRIGCSSRVHVQPVAWAERPSPAAGRVADRASSRRPREVAR